MPFLMLLLKPIIRGIASIHLKYAILHSDELNTLIYLQIVNNLDRKKPLKKVRERQIVSNL